MSDLTVEELQGLVETELGADALQLLIDAAEEMLPPLIADSLVEHYPGGSRVIILDHVADVVATVREGDATEALEAGTGDDDPDAEYRLESDGRSITRLEPHSETAIRRWWGPVRVEYVPRSKTNLRKLVTVELVKGALANNPGVLGITEGNYTVQFANGETWSSTSLDALSRLDEPWSFA
jgi:hypothetical protein